MKFKLVILMLSVLITALFAVSCVPTETVSVQSESPVKKDETVETDGTLEPENTPAATETKTELSQSPEATEICPEPTATPTEVSSDSLEPALPETSEVAEVLTAEPTELNYPIGLFSWDADAYTIDNGARLYLMLKALDITEIYQSFEEGELETQEAERLLKDAHTMGVDVYYLAGSRDWGLEKNGKSMIEQIALVKEYNEKHSDAPFKGVMFDVETFLNEAWDKDPAAVMDSFTSGSRKMYQSAQKAGLRVIHCVPVWYDSQGYGEQLKILCDSCDELSVMNYDRRDEIENMRTETELARVADKPITCIFEFQSIKYHGLTDNETYYNFGIDAAVESFEKLYLELDYDGMKFAYHYFRPLNEIID